MEVWKGLYLVSLLNVVFSSPEASYTVHLNSLSFEDAEKHCNPGGFLTNIKDEEIDKIQKAIGERNNKTTTSFWIGLKKKKGECVKQLEPLKGFSWTVDNSTYLHGIRWKQIPRDTCTDERCGLLSVEYSNSGLAFNSGLMSDGCKKEHAFICKRNIKVTCPKPNIFDTHDNIENSNDPYTLQINCNSGAKFTLTCSNNLHWSVIGNENMDISQLCLQCKNGYRREASGDCVDINECESNPCKHTCVNNEGSYKCVCAANDVCGESTTPPTDLKHNGEDPTHSSANRGDSVPTQTTFMTDDVRTNEENNGDISNIVVPVIIALLIFVVLLVIIAAIVKGCLRRRSVKLAQRKAEAVALNGSGSMEKINKGHLSERDCKL